MAVVPVKVFERLSAGLKRFQPILTSAKARDVNESDTVTIVIDILGEIFGFDKYAEITKEYAIRGTYCDLALKIDGQIQLLIEVKAIGLEMKAAHVKQAIDYAANQGVEWVALTTGAVWRIYRVIFAKPIDMEIVAEIDLLSLNPKSQSHLEQLFLLSREGWVKSTLSAYYTQRQATNKFFLAALLQTDSVVESIRKELRKVVPEVKVQPEEIREALIKEVLKREVVEGEKADEATKKITKVLGKSGAGTTTRPKKEKEKPEVRITEPAAGEVVEVAPPVEPSDLHVAIEASIGSKPVEEPESNSTDYE